MRKAITIYYDEEEGKLDSAEDCKPFADESAIMRADVLKDVMHWASKRYDDAVIALHESILDQQREAQRLETEHPK